MPGLTDPLGLGLATTTGLLPASLELGQQLVDQLGLVGDQAGQLTHLTHCRGIINYYSLYRKYIVIIIKEISV